MKNKYIKFSSYIAFSLIIMALCGMQMLAYFTNEKDLSMIISKNESKIERLFAYDHPPVTMRNKYFNIALPNGMAIYAHAENNLKIRYQEMYYDVHILTSNLSTDVYAADKYAFEKKHVLPSLDKNNVFAYSKEVDVNYMQVGLYTENIEISFIVPSVALEQSLMKATELLRNIDVITVGDEPIFIGSNDEKKQQTILEGRDGEQAPVEEPVEEPEIIL